MKLTETLKLQTLFLIVLLALFAGNVQAQFDEFGDETRLPQRYFFGICLIPATNGDLYHFAEIEKLSDTKFNYTWITRQEFIAKALGIQYSKANPDSIDLFEHYGIKTDNIYWDPIDNLWRLRFDGHPYYPDDKTGWFVPNPEYTIPDSLYLFEGQIYDQKVKNHRDSLILVYNNQKKMLSDLGIRKFSDYVMGEKAFQLIKSVQDIAWIANYNNVKQLPPALKRAIEGKPLKNKAGQKTSAADKDMVIHKPYKNVTISTTKKSGLEQLLYGPKGKKKNQ